MHRWPRSVHCQIEAVLHCIRSIGQSKDSNPQGIRSLGTWKLYRKECHVFANYLSKIGLVNILDARPVTEAMDKYLLEKLNYYASRKRVGSLQTYEVMLSALGKFEYAVNQYIFVHELDYSPLDVAGLRRQFYTAAKRILPASSRSYDSRAYPDPIKIIENIDDPVYQLQASLQYEGGFRCEGVGAPRQQRLRNPITAQSLCGVEPDLVTGVPAGKVIAREKGGKETCHFISLQTYQQLESFIQSYGKLESNYHGYIQAINDAAKKTGQFVPGRGSHGLKHNFAEERYHECARHGLTHEESAQQTSLEMAHFRLTETEGYTKGRK